MTESGSDTSSDVLRDVPILLIEDEPQLRRFLRITLDNHGCLLTEAASGEEGLQAATRCKPAIVLLDLGLPDMDGMQVTRRLREWTQVPVIVISARGQEQDKITALDAGADDYLTKPFSIGELLARIRVALRHASRIGDEVDSQFATGGLKVDLGRRQVFVEGAEVHLTPIEYKLLMTLVRNAGKVVTHRQLLKDVWGQQYSNENHYLRVYMGQLRHKLEEDPARPRYLTTEPGVGYRLRVDR